MDHHHIAVLAGQVTSINDETRGSPQTAGPTGNKKQQRDSIDTHCAPQSVQDIDNLFNRLARQFGDMGLALHPLAGDTLLVACPALGMSCTLPDLRAARSYLQQIGGAT